MEIIDLSHTIREGMPVYPGTEPPTVTAVSTYEKDHYRESCITMYTHTGTHIDPPAHIVKGGATLDMLSVDSFIGTATVIDCRDMKPSSRFGMERLRSVGERLDRAEFLIFNFGWDKYWGSPEYFEGYPCIDEDVAEYIVSSGKKGVGVDCISVDPVASIAIHKMLFKKSDIVIVENLTNLERLGERLFIFAALPLKIFDGDGSPIRAAAILL